MNAMPNALTVLHHIGVGMAVPLSCLCLLEILALYVPDLGDDNHFISGNFLLLHEIANDRTDHTLTLTIHIIG